MSVCLSEGVVWHFIGKEWGNVRWGLLDSTEDYAKEGGMGCVMKDESY